MASTFQFVLLAAVPVVMSSSIAGHAQATTPIASPAAVADPGTGVASTSLDVIEASATGTPQTIREFGGTNRAVVYPGAGTDAEELLVGYEAQSAAQHDGGIGGVAGGPSPNGGTIERANDSTVTTLGHVARAAAYRKEDTEIAPIGDRNQAAASDGLPLISSRQDGGSLPTVAVAAPTTSYFSSSGAPVSTEGATLTWKLTRTGDTGSELTVPLKWSHSTGSGGPYANFFVFTEDNPKVESVTFGVGVSEVTLSVDTVDDSVFELNSVLRICPSNDTDDGYGVTYESNWWNCAGFHIQDNDASQAPLLTIAASTASATEGDQLIFTLELSYALNFDVRVAMRSSAVHKDRSIPPRSARVVKTLRAGSTAASVGLALPNNNRTSVEDNYTQRLRILDPTPRKGSPIGGYRLASATRQAEVEVKDDDLPVVSVSAPTMQSEATALTFTFTRADDITRPLVVPLSFTQSGNWLPVSVPSTVSFPTGAAQQTITLQLDDGVDEPNGSVSLGMQSTEDFSIASNSQQVTVLITDDDEPQHISIARSEASVEEGTDVTFTLTRKTLVGDSLTTNGQALEWPLGVRVNVTQEGDFVSGTAPRFVAFAANSTTATLTVQTADDEPPAPTSSDSSNRFHSSYEQDGSVTATLSAGDNYVVGAPPDHTEVPTSAKTAVSDNEPSLVRATVEAGVARDKATTMVTVSEGDSFNVHVERFFGDQTAAADVVVAMENFNCYSVSRPELGSLRPALPGEVPFATEEDRSVTVTIPVGETTATHSVATQEDAAFECDVAFSAVVQPPADSGDTAYASWDYHPMPHDIATVRVTNDDSLPKISFTSSTVSEDQGEVFVTATLSSDGLMTGYESAWPYTVTWWTIANTADAVTDFTAVESGTFTFPASPTVTDYSRRMSVTIIDDTLPEPQEQILFGYRISTPFDNAVALLRQGLAPTISINSDDQLPTITAPASINTSELNGSVAINVTLSNQIGIPVSIEWQTVPGTARSDGASDTRDFNHASGTLTFPPNVTSGRIVIRINSDSIYERRESFSVAFSSPENGTLARTSTTITISNIDPIPSILLRREKAKVGEGEGFARFRVLLRARNGFITHSAETITATLTASNGTNSDGLRNAISGLDFAATPVSIEMLPGTGIQDVDVPLIDDAIDEFDEDFHVTLGNVQVIGAAVPRISRTSSVSIVDNDDFPRVSIADARFNEPANPTGRTGRNIRVRLDRPSVQEITVTYRTVEGTAKTGGTNVLEHANDYVDVQSGSVSFAPGETSKAISIVILGDEIAEEEETFEVELLTATNSRLSDSIATATIRDRSRTPVITVDTFNSASTKRIREAHGRKRILVSLNHPDDTGRIVSGRTVTVDYEIYDFEPGVSDTDGSATFGVDYVVPRTGTMTFPPGYTSVSIFVTIVDDEISELRRERFGFRLKDPNNAVLDSIPADFLVITDNDQNPPISVSDSIGLEDAGNIVFDVRLENVSTLPVSFRYSTAAGTASADSDFSATSGTFSFEPGTTTGTISVPITNDGVTETVEEKFTLDLSSPVNARLATTSATGSIIDDDRGLPPGQMVALVMSTRQVSIAEGATDGAQFTVKLASQPSGSVAVSIGKGTGTGLMITPDTLTFSRSNWDTAQNARVVAASDDDAEDDHDVLTLSASGGGYSGTTGTLLVVTIDDDEAGLTFAPTQLGIAEGMTDTYTVKPNSQPVESVRISITGSSATASDHHSVTIDVATLTFTPTNWTTAQTVTVTATDDDDAANETVVLEHSGIGRGYESATWNLTVTTVDDDSVGLVIKDSGGRAFGENPALTIDEGTSAYVTVALATEPTGAVSLTVSVPAAADITVDDDSTPKTRTLMFTNQDWDVPQRVNIGAAADGDTIAPTPTTVTFDPDGADYESLASTTLTLNVRDTNSVDLIFSRNNLRVIEDATAGSTYTVRLGSQPQADSMGTETVTVRISASTGSGLAITPNSLTFTRDNWSTGQTVTLTAAHDDDASDGLATLTHAASGAAEYHSLSVSFSVRIIDDDTPAITIVPTQLDVDEGGTASYSVKLATKPDADVTVTITGSANSDFSLNKTRLTFTTENWNVAQSVIAEAAEDDDAVSDTIAVLHTGSGTEYTSVTSAIQLRTIEDEEVALAISDTAITVAEGSTATFTVALASLPSGTVTVALSGQAGTDAGLSASLRTFTTENWATAQTITITTSHDADASDDTVIVQLYTTSNNYNAPIANVTITIVDDETAGFTLSGAAVTIDEGGHGSFTIRPQTPPSRPITVEFTYPATSDLALPSTSIAFTSSNWSTPHTVRLSARHDNDAANDTGVILTYTGKGFEYEGLTGTISVTITDDDTNALVFTSTDGRAIPDDGLSAVEGGQVSYAVRLDTEPTDTVTVTVNAGMDLTASPTMLTFTTANWRARQTVTLAVGQDDDASADSATVGHTASGGGYGSVTGSVTVAVADNDTPSIILLDTGRDGLAVTEGTAARYRVRLGTQPSESVTVTISGHSGTDISPDKTTLSFTTSNWNTAQTVEITASEDDDALTNNAITLTHTAVGGDYADKSARTTVSIVENDSDGFVLTVAGGRLIADNAITVTEGTSTDYTVALSAKPTGNVNVTLVNLGAAISINETSLGFTRQNWRTPQAVTVTAISDPDGQDVSAQVPHLATGSGYKKHSFVLRVTVEDDDVSAVVVNRTSLEIDEGGNGNFVVRLGTRPLGEVVVALGLVEGSGLATQGIGLDSETLMFTRDNWNSAQRVVVNAGEDDDGVNERGIIGLMARGADYDAVANSLDVIVNDDDDPGLDVSESAITMKEDTTASFTVKLSTAPSETVSVNIDGNVGTDLSLDTTSLSFTQSNWDTAQTITLTTVGDADLTDDTVTLTLRADGGEYSGVSDTVTVTIDDDDPGVRVSFGASAYGVGEGGSVTVTVQLSADPERTVTVPVAAAGQGGATSADFSGVPAGVTFNSGDTSKTFSFAATDDSDDDDDESVRLSFGNLPAGVSAGTPAQSVVSIDDDDRPSTFEVSFGSAAYTVAEGGSVTVTVQLTSDAETAVTVPLTATRLGGATAGDYSGVPAGVAFGAGDDSKTFSFAATQDDDDDDGESVRLSFGTMPAGLSAGTTAQSVVSIDDDDDPGVRVSFGASAYGVGEGGSVTVTVQLSADPERTVTVPVAAAGQGGATSADFSGVPAGVTFNSGDTSKTFSFAATDDSDDDDDESVRLSFGNLPAGVSAGTPAQSVVSIDDDDRPSTFEVSFGSAAYTVAEGGSVTVTVQLTSDAETAVTVPLTATRLGGATAGDYSGVPAGVAFGAGDDSKTFSFAATQDDDDDDGESVRLSFGTMPAGLSAGTTAQSVVSIDDDDDPGVRVSFGASAYGVGEGGSVTVTVQLSADPERTVTVPVAAAGQGGATSADFSGVPAGVTFNSGDTSKTFSFAATDDSDDDDDESVRLSFGNLPAGVSAGTPAQSVVSIDDDDRPSTFEVSFGSAAYTVAEGGSVTVTVQLTSDAETAVTVPLTATRLGGAAAGDYSGVPAGVAFGAGDDSKTFSFAATQDDDDDDGESVRLSFGTMPAGLSAGTTAQSVVSIDDDDDPGVRVSFGASAYGVGEGGSVTVTVQLSADPERTVTVPVAAAGQGGATSADFSGVPAGVTFNSGDTSKTFSFAATDDSDDDDDESVRLSFGNLPAGVSAGTTAQSVVSIDDDDRPSTFEVSFGSAAYTVAEGGSVTVTVQLTSDAETAVTVPLTATRLGGATAGDYSGVPAGVAFGAGDDSKTFSFAATQDDDDDDGESVRLSFGTMPAGLSAGTTAQSVVSIDDDDDPGVRVSFGASAYGVGEGGSVTVTVQLSADPERTVTVPVAAAGQGGATSADFSGVPAGVTFNSGDTSKTFSFAATDDSDDDDDESVRLSFGNLPAGVSAGTPAQSVVSIDDDDRPSTFEVSFGSAAYTVAEGGSVTVTVQLTSDAETAVTVPLTATRLGGATAGDYSGVPAGVAFGAGDDSKTFSFAATQDDDDDDGESVRLSFGTMPAGLSAGTTAQSVVSIDDDDDPGVRVSFGAAAYGVGEGGSVTVTVQLSADPERTVTVPVAAAGQGGATSADFSGVPAGVTFNSGDTSKTFSFAATDDSDDDDDESVRLSFGNLPAGVSAGTPAQSVVSIDDDDRPSTFEVSFGSAAYTVAEGGSVTVTVQLTSDAETAVTVPLTATRLGGAAAGDYSGVPAGVAFGAGDDSKTFSFAATQDDDDDDGESVRLSFGTMPAGLSAGTTAQSVVSIDDDDDPGVRVSFGASAYGVGEGGSVTVTVQLSADPERTVTVPVAAAGQGGATSADFSGVPAGVTFNSGDTSKTFSFAATDDSDDDDDESVRLSFGNLPAGVSAGTTAQSVVSIDDDDRPSTFEVSFGSAAYTVAEGGSVTVTVQLTSDAETAVTVPLTATRLGGATAGDYSGVPAGVAFGAGDDSKTFSFAATQDDDDDDGESVRLSFGTMPAGLSAGTTAQSVVSIDDDDDPGVRVSFGASAYGVGEGGSVTVTVQLSADPERTVTVPVAAAGQGGATSADFSGVPAGVTFNSGDTSKTFSFAATDDSDDDDDESVRLSFGNLPAGVSAGTTAQSVVSIDDDDRPSTFEVSFGSAAYTVAEGGSVTVTVQLTSDAETAVTVPLTATRLGGATAGDYSGVPAGVAFGAGDDSKTFSFAATQDDDDDDGESVRLSFGTMPAGLSAGTTAQSVVSIDDDDDPGVRVSFGAAAYGVGEGGSVTVTVQLSADPERTVTVPVAAAGQGGATSADFSGVPAGVTFNSGDTSKTFSFAATDDSDDDDDESVRLSFGNLPAGVSAGTPAQSVVSIDDDDRPSTFEVSFGSAAYTVAEGGSVTVTVQLTSDAETAVTVPLTATRLGGAAAGDYSGVPAGVAFGAGDDSKTFSFAATQDDDDDDGESVRLSFGTMPAGLSAGTTAQSVVSIDDDDDPGVRVSFGASAYGVGEGGSVTVTVQLSADPERTVTVPVAAAGQGGATSADFSGVPAGVTFNSGDTSKTFSFAATDDSDDDDDESVRLSFGNLPAGVSAGTPAQSVVSIDDDDRPSTFEVSFGSAAYTVAEGGSVTVTVQLTSDAETAVTVPLTATRLGGATAGDYSGVPAGVAFGAGDDSKTFSFAATQDDDDDDGESVRLSFGTMPAGLSAGTTAQSVVSIDDDDSGQPLLDCSLALWCADLRFEDYTALNEGWSHLQYSESFNPPASLSDTTFDFRGVDYTIRHVYVFPGAYPEIDNAFNRAQRDQAEFEIAISHGRTWQGVPEEIYLAWELHIDGVALPFSESARMGKNAFQWYGPEFQKIFTDWTPSTTSKIGIREISPTQHLPAALTAPAYIGTAAQGTDQLRISWSPPLSRLRNQSITGYTVQWKQASDSWSDSAAVLSKQVAPKPTSMEVDGLTEGVLYTVRVIATNAEGDSPPSEDAIGRPQPQSPSLVSAVVNGTTLTLRYSRQLDTGSVPANSAFVVADGIALRTVDSVEISGTEVTLTLTEAVTSTHSIWVSYVAPTDASATFLRDSDGNHVRSLGASDIRIATNETDPALLQSLTAQFTNVPSSHDGATSFTFNIVFSESVWISEGLGRDHLLQVTGGTVTAAYWLDRRTERWAVTVRPDTRGDIVIVLPGLRDCMDTGAPCAAGDRVLSSGNTATVPGPASQRQAANNPATGAPGISGTARVGETLTATTTGISDADGLANATFGYQWLADDIDLGGATGSTYTVTGADVGKTISVRVSFTDDAGHRESVISAATAAVTSSALRLQSAAADGDTLTLNYNEYLDQGVTLPVSAFTVTVNTNTRSVSRTSLDGTTVTLTLAAAVEAGDTVTVGYSKPDGPNFIRSTLGNVADSFSGEAATNTTADSTDTSKATAAPANSTPLTAVFLDTPETHDGQTVFISS